VQSISCSSCYAHWYHQLGIKFISNQSNAVKATSYNMLLKSHHKPTFASHMSYTVDGNLSFNRILHRTFILNNSCISNFAAYGIFIFVTAFELWQVVHQLLYPIRPHCSQRSTSCTSDESIRRSRSNCEAIDISVPGNSMQKNV
jgi:hypothetical protein